MAYKKYHSVRLSSKDIDILIAALYTQAETDLDQDETADLVVLRRRLEGYKAREV